MSSSKEAQPNMDPSDDLDDLDDILDEFNAAKKPAAGLTPSASNSSTHPDAPAAREANRIPDTLSSDAPEKEETEEEANERFAKELAVGMEALMKGLGGPQDGTLAHSDATKTASDATTGNETLFNEEEMMKQFEQMMAEMGLGGMTGLDGMSGSDPTVPKSNANTSSTAPPPPANFQEAIKNTMSRLRESDATASSNTAGGDSMDLEKLMAALGNGEGLEGEEGMAKMLETMMGELMSKEVLYDPLKELKDKVSQNAMLVNLPMLTHNDFLFKYPGYLANPPAPLSAEDRNRYQTQYSIVSQVIAVFDDKKFETGTEAEKSALKAKVQNLMNEMQDNGAPPAEIVGDLPPELENMPGLGGDENCSIM